MLVGFHGCAIPDSGLAEVDVDACLMEEGVPNLHKDLSKRDQDHTVDVVKVSKEHLPLTQCGIDCGFSNQGIIIIIIIIVIIIIIIIIIIIVIIIIIIIIPWSENPRIFKNFSNF